MAQVRTQPLPAGRYWLDVVPGTLDTFRAWIASNPSRAAIEHSEAAGGVTFFIFRLSKPTRFDQRTFGFPNTAEPEIKTAADTVLRPSTPTPASTLQDLLQPVADALSAGTGSGLGRALIIGGLIWAFSKADP